MKLNNPFVISNEYVSEEYFCDRKFETKVLVDNILNGRNTVLISMRRMGKSGLISHCFNSKTISESYTTFFVDLYSTSSLSEMVSLMGKEILDSLKGKGEKVIDRFIATVKSLVAGITIDPITGQPTLNISIGNILKPDQTLKEIFEYDRTFHRSGKVCFGRCGCGYCSHGLHNDSKNEHKRYCQRKSENSANQSVHQSRMSDSCNYFGKIGH